MNLKEFFSKNNKIALAFSGGVDSAYLLYAAKKYGADIKPYFVKSQFQPKFELEDAKRLAKELNVDLAIIKLDVLDDKAISDNPSNRCYYCKKRIFDQIIKQAKQDGYNVIIDGTNASDDIGDRPGFAALQEMKVLSPLRECGITKAELRRFSKEAGLFTWDKPSYACLATRIPSGKEIDEQSLKAIECSENYMMELGFRNFRVRQDDKNARIEIEQKDKDLLFANLDRIIAELKKYYNKVTLDLEFRK